MRIFVRALLRDADQLQNFARTVHRLLGGDLLMQSDDFGDLIADGVHRVKAGHRILEDHGDLVAADTVHAVFRGGDEILAVKEDLAAGIAASRLLDQLHDGQCHGGLARAGFADQADGLAGIDFERHAVDRLNLAALGHVVNVQVFNLKELFILVFHGIVSFQITA